MEIGKEVIKITIVNDDILIARLLSDYFKKENKLKVIKTLGNGNEFLRYIDNAEILPDVVLLDLRMENGSALDVLQELSTREKMFKVIVLSTYYNESFIGQMLKLGCDAFLPKEVDPEELIEIINEIHEKGYYFSYDQINYLRSSISNKSPALQLEAKEKFTDRELEILELICEQLTAREIAERMFISIKTVEVHKSNLLLKSGVKNTVGLILYAVKNQLIDPNTLLLLDM